MGTKSTDKILMQITLATPQNLLKARSVTNYDHWSM